MREALLRGWRRWRQVIWENIDDVDGNPRVLPLLYGCEAAVVAGGWNGVGDGIRDKVIRWWGLWTVG